MRPTAHPKGLEVYEAVRDKLIADPEMTARWEKDLQEIERGELDADVFIQKVGNTRGRSWRNSRGPVRTSRTAPTPLSQMRHGDTDPSPEGGPVR